MHLFPVNSTDTKNSFNHPEIKKSTSISYRVFNRQPKYSTIESMSKPQLLEWLLSPTAFPTAYDSLKEPQQLANWYFTVIDVEDLYESLYTKFVSLVPNDQLNLLDWCYQLTLNEKMSSSEMKRLKVRQTIEKIDTYIRQNQANLEKEIYEKLRQKSSLLSLKYNEKFLSRKKSGSNVSESSILGLQETLQTEAAHPCIDIKDIFPTLFNRHSYPWEKLDIEPKNMENIVVEDKNLQSLSEYVEAVAKDMMLMQKSLIKRILPTDVYLNDKDDLSSKAQLANLWNKIAYFVSATVLSQITIESQVNALRFFHLLLHYLFKAGDFQSASAISTGLQSYRLQGLRMVHKKYKQHFKHEYHLTCEYHKTFSYSKNFTNIRSKMKKMEKKERPFLPCIQPYLHALTALKENKPTNSYVYLRQVKLFNNDVDHIFRPFKNFRTEEKLSTNLADILFEMKILN